MSDDGDQALRQSWQRGTPALAVDAGCLADTMAAIFPGAQLRSATPLSGGMANTNLHLSFAGEPGDLVLRLYQRDPGQMMKEAAIAARLDGRVPLADFLHVDPDPKPLGAPFALLRWIDGVTLDSVLPALEQTELDALGETLGRLLATIHGEHFAQSGFLGGDLNVVDTFTSGGEGLIAFCAQHMADKLVTGRLGKDRCRDLMAFVERRAYRLNQWQGPPCLTHADFGGSNILVKRTDGGVDVTAILDWEFAFAGSPFFDLGNLTRPPLDGRPSFLASLEQGYRTIDSSLPDDWQALSRLVDLTAWIDFAGRPAVSQAVLDDAVATIDRTIGSA